MRLRSWVLLASFLLAACAGSTTRIVDAGLPDAGGTDAGTVDGGKTDGGTMDAGTTDGGTGAVELTPATPSLGDRRGPILLYFTLSDPGHVVSGFHLDFSTGGAFAPATTMYITQSGSDVLAVWNSFADVNTDTSATARLTATAPSGDVQASIQVSLKNDPETDRLILVGRNLVMQPDGSATETGTTVSAVTWSGKTMQLSDMPTSITVGQGPSDLRAAPHGRATAVVEATSGHVSLVATPLDASTAGVKVITSLALPNGSAADARWSPDGRYLYVAGQSPNAMWRFEPTEDLSSVRAPVMLAALDGAPSRFDVDRTTGMLLVACGIGIMDGSTSKLVLLKPDGTEAARLTEDLDSANGLVINPAGGFALWTGSFSGDQVRLFQFTANSITEPGMPITTVPSPTEIVFHPASTATSGAVLISDLDHDGVTPLTYSGTTLTPGTLTKSVPLASELDLIERGSQAGTVFATSVSAISRIELSSTGTAKIDGSIYDFGMATEDIVQGIAVQR